MLLIRETTVWSGNTPNHTYLVSNDRRKMVGYIPAGRRRMVTFSRPMGFDIRGRTFTLLERRADDVVEDVTPVTAPAARTVTVTGSSGSIYTLTQSGGRWSCSCPGYGFRGRCKHSDGMKDTK